MATEKRTIVEVKSDISGEVATEKISYSVNGTRYEIDLTETEAKEFHESLLPYVAVSRVRGQRKDDGTPRRDRKAATERAAAIRAWAKEKKIKLPDTGRIPNSVQQQYDADKGK